MSQVVAVVTIRTVVAVRNRLRFVKRHVVVIARSGSLHITHSSQSLGDL